MTDDVTRGLTALADEAEPATIDTYAVITRARARTRNRTTVAAAVLGVVAVAGVLTLTGGAMSGGGVDAAAPATGLPETEQAYADRLRSYLTAAAPSDVTFEVAPGSDDDNDPATGSGLPLGSGNLQGGVLAHAALTSGDVTTQLGITTTGTAGFTFSQCPSGARCEERTVAEGVTAWVADYTNADGNNHMSRMEVWTPSEVVILGETGAPTLLLDTEEWFALATEIGSDTDPGTAPATPKTKLVAALRDVLTFGGTSFELQRYPGDVHEPRPTTGPLYPMVTESLINDQAGTTTVGYGILRGGDFTIPACPEGAAHCEERTLPNGNTAFLTADFSVPGEPGLVSQVAVKAGDTVYFVSERNLDRDGNVSRPELLFDTEQMFALATALS